MRQHKTNTHCCGHHFVRRLFVFSAMLFVVSILFFLDTKTDLQNSVRTITHKDGILSISDSKQKGVLLVPLMKGWKQVQLSDGKTVWQIKIMQSSDQPLSLLIPDNWNDSQISTQNHFSFAGRPYEKGRSLLCIQISPSLYDAIQKNILPFPIAGTTKDLNHFFLVRLIFRSFLFFCSIVIFIVLSVLTLLCRGKIPMSYYFCAGAFFFVLHSGSGFLWTLSSSSSIALTFLRKDSLLFMLLFIILSAQISFDFHWKKFGFFSLFLCILTCVHPLFLYFSNANIYSQYVFFIHTGAIFLALYLICISIRTLYRNMGHYFLLCANILLGLSILFEILCQFTMFPLIPGRYMDFCCLLLLLLYCLEVLFFGSQKQTKNISLSKHLTLFETNWTKQQFSLDVEKKQLLTNAAHNLKAPLSAMHMYLDMIRNLNVNTNINLEQYLKGMERKNMEMQKRVSEISTFLSLEKPSSKKEPLFLSVFLKNFYQMSKPDADASGIYFLLELPDQDALIYGDFQELQGVLENLFINALDFTPFEGTITLSATTQQTWVSIFLQDSGCGIPSEVLPNIFDFGVSKREENEQARGIGLYCARLIIREHGGDISVLSSSKKGTIMHVKLPRIR